MAQEKPFDPTPSKLAKARRDGDSPRSSDLNAIASFACASLALFALLDLARGAASDALVRAAASTRAANDAMGEPFSQASPGPYVVLGAIVLAVVACAAAGTVGATFAQTRRLAIKFPAPKFEKLDPIAGLKRMLSRDAIVGGAKALVVACAVGAAVVPTARDAFAAIASGATASGLAALVVASLRTIVASALAVAAFFAVGDFFLERAKWRKRLKMTFEELKRDSRASDGDPLVRGRRRSAHRALVRGSIARVADAAFVIANPTHVAIALEYRPPEVAVPRVLVRAIDAGAQEVKRRARESRVPIVENVALARTLLAATEVGDVIPPDTYAAVAAIVAMLARSRAIA